MVNIFTNGFDVDEACVKDIVEGALESDEMAEKFEVNVNFVTEKEMLKLHDKKLHEVLSFPLEDPSTSSGRFAVGPDGIVRLGDIVVLGSLPWQKRDELIAHSCLHLLGIHHKE